MFIDSVNKIQEIKNCLQIDFNSIYLTFKCPVNGPFQLPVWPYMPHVKFPQVSKAGQHCQCYLRVSVNFWCSYHVSNWFSTRHLWLQNGLYIAPPKPGSQALCCKAYDDFAHCTRHSDRLELFSYVRITMYGPIYPHWRPDSNQVSPRRSVTMGNNSLATAIEHGWNWMKPNSPDQFGGQLSSWCRFYTRRALIAAFHLRPAVFDIFPHQPRSTNHGFYYVDWSIEKRWRNTTTDVFKNSILLCTHTIQCKPGFINNKCFNVYNWCSAGIEVAFNYCEYTVNRRRSEATYKSISKLSDSCKFSISTSLL